MFFCSTTYIFHFLDKLRTFKLRLPAIRRSRQKSPEQRQRRPRAAEGGEGHGSSSESMPLQHFSPFVERLCPPRLATGIWGHEHPITDHDPTDATSWYDTRYPAWKGSQASLRKASSLEETEGKKSPGIQISRAEPATQSSGRSSCKLFNCKWNILIVI